MIKKKVAWMDEVDGKDFSWGSLSGSKKKSLSESKNKSLSRSKSKSKTPESESEPEWYKHMDSNEIKDWVDYDGKTYQHPIPQWKYTFGNILPLLIMLSCGVSLYGQIGIILKDTYNYHDIRKHNIYIFIGYFILIILHLLFYSISVLFSNNMLGLITFLIVISVISCILTAASNKSETSSSEAKEIIVKFTTGINVIVVIINFILFSKGNSKYIKSAQQPKHRTIGGGNKYEYAETSDSASISKFMNELR